MFALLLTLLAATASPCCLGLTAPDTSLATLPVAYFGGLNQTRPDTNIAMLAKQRVVVIEKWEGPCWDACLQNNTRGVPCVPSCDGSRYIVETLRRVKAANAKVATGYYQNSMYLWRFQELYAAFARNDECLRNISGGVVGLVNDNGMTGVPVFSLDQPDAIARYTAGLHSLIATGVVDGIYLDKANIKAWKNDTTELWQVCEFMTVRKHPWSDSCAPVSEAVAAAWNAGKDQMCNNSFEVFRSQGGFVMNPNANVSNMRVIVGKLARQDTIEQLQKRVDGFLAELSVDYVFFNWADSHSDRDPKDLASLCSQTDLARFLLTMQRRVFCGCDGWSDDFSRPLGEPTGPATHKGHVWERSFASGTHVSFNENTNKATITWATSR